MCPTEPFRSCQVGDRITGGDIYADVVENSLLNHRIMAQPNVRGKITYIAEPGLQAMLLCCVEDRIGILSGCSGLYTVSTIITSTNFPEITMISLNYHNSAP